MRLGQGPRNLICFHGYGESASGFSFLEEPLGTDFSCFCIDLPFHGQTEWKEAGPLHSGDLKDIIHAILRQSGQHDQRYTVMGFSLGGRMALSLYQADPVQCEKLVLLAPDGLKVNFWYWLATQTSWGNRFFRYTMLHPRWYFGLLKMMNALGLVNASIFKFVRYYIGDATVREALYQRWTVLRKIKPDLAIIRSLINERQTPVRLLYGLHDRIILPAVGERFRKGIEKHCSLNLIHSGHQLLHARHLEEILPALLR